MLKSKSGLNVRYSITSDGVIDEGCTGSIVVRLKNDRFLPYNVRRGDKITQLVVLHCEYVDFEVIDKLDDSERGDGGFGSTGK